RAEIREMFQPSVLSLPPGDSAISLLPASIAKETPGALAHMPAEASISILPSAVAPRSAAQADVQAMVAPRQPIVPASDEIAKMSGDSASGVGEAIMDRILYIKGTPASGTAAPVQGSASAAPSQLKPARRGLLYYALAGPAKLATKST